MGLARLIDGQLLSFPRFKDNRIDSYHIGRGDFHY